MPNYELSKIYKIWSPSNKKLKYIGSTTMPLTIRMSGHKYKYKKYISGLGGYLTAFEIFKLGDAQISLIENFPCTENYQLLKRESYHIKRLKCVNRCVPYDKNSVRVDYFCETCNTTINKKSKVRHLRSKKHLDTITIEV